MDPNLRINIKCREQLEPIRRLLRQQTAGQVAVKERSEKSFCEESWCPSGPYLEMFCFNSSQIREKHFNNCLKINDKLIAKIVTKLDSNLFCLKLIQSETRFLSDLQIGSQSVLVTTGDRDLANDLDINDFVRVVVTDVLRDQKRIVCKLIAVITDWTENHNSFSNVSFNNYIKDLNEFRNPFVLKQKSISSLILNQFIAKQRKSETKTQQKSEPKSDSRYDPKSDSKSYVKCDEKTDQKSDQKLDPKVSKSKRKRSSSTDSSSSTSSSDSSSSTSSSSSTTSSSDSSDDDRRKRRKKSKKKKKSRQKKYKKVEKKNSSNEKSSKKFSFVMKKSLKSSSNAVIPGLDNKSDDRQSSDRKRYLSDKMKRQLKRDEEIERKIHLMAKNVQNY